MSNSQQPEWYTTEPVKWYKDPTNITLANGHQDIEKGDIFSSPAGTPVSIPQPATVAWEDSQQVVLQSGSAVYNLLHVNPTVPVGTKLAPNETFADVSHYVGLQPPGICDTVGGVQHCYEESGNIIEFGVYDSVARAVARDNPNANDFTGIYNPDQTISAWAAGSTAGGPSTPWKPPSTPGGTNPAPVPIQRTPPDPHAGDITIGTPFGNVYIGNPLTAFGKWFKGVWNVIAPHLLQWGIIAALILLAAILLIALLWNEVKP